MGRDRKEPLPFRRMRGNALTAALAFLPGAYFDLTPYRLDPASPLAGSGVFLTLSRIAGGLLLAFIVLSLLRAGRDLLSLGRIGWRRALVLFLALNALTALYVLTSRTVYTWDTAGYWTVARDLSRQRLGRSQIFEVLRSTIHEDYNALLAFPVSLVMRVFGGSRAVFLFSISNLYTLPGLWALAALGKGRKGGAFLLAALFPMLVYIGLVGFVDTAACAMALWAYVVYGSDRPPVSRGVMAGALLVGSFLLRRYFFFFAASFGAAALVKKLLFERGRWADFAALFASCAVCAVYFTPNFLLEKVLGTDYGDIYSAYDLGLKSDALLFCRYFGLVLLIALAACAAAALVRRPEGRGGILLALVQLTVCFAAFVSVQSHGQQHLLLYLPGLAALASAAALNTPGPWAALLAALTLGGCLIPKAQPASIDAISSCALLPSFTFYGPEREDVDELLSLAGYLDGLAAQEPHTAVILSSSLVLNSDTLPNLYASLSLPEPEKRIAYQYHGTVDKRDAFNWNTVTADYLIVGDPVQTHLGEENQRVLTLLAHYVLDGAGPGAAYRELPESFSLAGGVTVRVFKLERPWTAEEYREIAEPLMEMYPDYAELYAVPSWIE